MRGNSRKQGIKSPCDNRLGIEYTADVVWGLQLQAIRSNDIFEKERDIVKKRKVITDAKSAIPREVELCCLKNRYGKASYYCAFRYDPRYDYFEPDNGFRKITPEDEKILASAKNYKTTF